MTAEQFDQFLLLFKRWVDAMEKGVENDAERLEILRRREQDRRANR